MRSILDHARSCQRASAGVLPAIQQHIYLLTKDVDAVLFIHSGHENERQSSGDPHEHWGSIFKVLIFMNNLGAHFLIVEQKTLSKNQLTAPLYKLCTQLSTKIVDSFLQLDCRWQRLSSAFVFLSPSLLRLSMRFKVARIFKCRGVERNALESSVLHIIEAAGWPIWPLILCSIVTLGIIGERFYSLRKDFVAPRDLLPKVVQEYRQNGVSSDMLNRLAQTAMLGRIFAAALKEAASSREIMKESIEEAGRAAAHELERFLTTLGTIATMAPLLGLLGTIIGMIEIFGSQGPTGMANPGQLAHGISIALYNAAFGIIVAVPSLVFYRHFRARVDSLVVEMEVQAVKLVEIIHGQRQA
jgi:biopolymer transport protein ExbB